MAITMAKIVANLVHTECNSKFFANAPVHKRRDRRFNLHPSTILLQTHYLAGYFIQEVGL